MQGLNANIVISISLTPFSNILWLIIYTFSHYIRNLHEHLRHVNTQLISLSIVCFSHCSNWLLLSPYFMKLYNVEFSQLRGCLLMKLSLWRRDQYNMSHMQWHQNKGRSQFLYDPILKRSLDILMSITCVKQLKYFIYIRNFWRNFLSFTYFKEQFNFSLKVTRRQDLFGKSFLDFQMRLCIPNCIFYLVRYNRVWID